MTDIIMTQQPVTAGQSKPRRRKAAIAESSAAGAAAAATPVKSKTVAKLAGERVGAPSPASRRRDRTTRRQELGDTPRALRPFENKVKGSKTAASLGIFEKDAESRSWNAANVAQTSVSTLPVVWSRDGQFYFIALDSTLQIRSVTKPTFPLLSTLRSHSGPITSFHLHPTEPFQLITSSQDGTLKIWDWLEGKLLRTIVCCTRGPVEKCCVGVDGDGVPWIYAAIKGTRLKKEGAARGDIYNHVLMVPAVTRGCSLADPVRLGKTTNSCTDIFISPLGSYLVVLAGFKAHVFRLGRIEPELLSKRSQKKFEYKVKNPAKRSGSPAVAGPSNEPAAVMDKGSFRFLSSDKLTCGAFCPVDKAGLGGLGGDAEEWFATGDEKGVVRLWFGLTEAFAKIDAAKAQSDSTNNTVAPFSNLEKRLPTTTLHWHAHAVAAISFNALGTQLLSVGEESVLVLWHLASGQKEFVPRLGGSGALSVAVKPGKAGIEEEYWIGMRDGALMRVGASSNKVSTVGKAVVLDTNRDLSNPYPLAVHPQTKAIVLPASHPSTIQFIDPSTQAVLFHLEVAPSNRVSRRDDKTIESVAVESVVFDSAGLWMATYESREGDDAEGGGRVRAVKIWQWEGETQAYKLNTHLPRAHGWDAVTSMAFTTSHAAEASGASTTPLFMTAAEQGEVKTWQLKRVNRILEVNRRQLGKGKQSSVVAESFWAARSTFNYRSQPVASATFSQDNTLIALAHPGVVTLWDAATNVLLKILPAVEIPSLKSVAFVGNDGRWLVAAGLKRGLVVWDLLSCEVAWSLAQLAVKHLVPHPTLPLFLAAAEAPTSKRAQACKFQLFDPASSTPLRTRTLGWTPRELTFIPATDGQQLEVVAVATGGDIWRLGDALPGSATSKGSASAAKITVEVTGQGSIWKEMFGEDAFVASEPAAAVPVVARTKTGSAADVYAGASHTMPPVSLLFDSFLEELLRPKHGKQLPVAEIEPEAEAEAILVDDVQMMDVGVQPALREPEGDVQVEDLTGFFKDLLSQPRELKAPARAVKSTPQKVTPKKQAVKTTATPVATPDTAAPAAEEDGEVGKKRKRNRK